MTIRSAYGQFIQSQRTHDSLPVDLRTTGVVLSDSKFSFDYRHYCSARGTGELLTHIHYS